MGGTRGLVWYYQERCVNCLGELVVGIPVIGNRAPQGASEPNGFMGGSCIPGRELLVCLVLVVTAEALSGGAEAGTGDSQSNGGLHPGTGQLSRSDEAGRADGAGRDAEDGDGRHGERRVGCGGGRMDVGEGRSGRARC